MGDTIDEKQFELIMQKIIAGIEKAGYDPYAQLTGYLATGNTAFITRTDGARDLIELLSSEQIKQYIDTRSKNK